MSAAGSALLIVDDNEDNRYTLTRRLRREGYENLTTSTDGEEALPGRNHGITRRIKADARRA